MTPKLHLLTVPTETQEAIALARWMRARGLVFIHVPNEGRRSVRQGALLRSIGVTAGVADYVIFSRAAKAPYGAVLELKRRVGGRPSAEQLAWLDTMAGLGWASAVCKGAREAVGFLEALGY